MISRKRVVSQMSALVGVLAFLVPVGGIAVEAAAGTLPAGYDRATRPDGPGVPTPVSCGVFILDLTEIDDVQQAFTASIYFDVRYRDPRLADSDAPRIRTFGLNEIWWPDLGLVNRRGLDFIFPHLLKVDREGNVVYNQRAFGDFSTPLNLRKFPFDAQRLTIEVISYSLGKDDIDLTVNLERTGRMELLSLSGWGVTTDKVDWSARRSDALQADQLVFYVDVARKVGYYRWSILVPLCLIVLMAWCVFWIEPQFLPSQIGLSTAAVFSLIAFRFSLNAKLPRLDYLTYLDEFVFASTVLVFLALGQAITTGRLAKTGYEQLADQIDVWSRTIYLVVFLVLGVMTLRLHF